MIFLCLLLGVGASAADDPPPATSPDPSPADPPPAAEAPSPVLQDLEQDLEFFLAEGPATAVTPTPTTQSSASAFNPAITAFGDAFWSLGVEDGALLEASGPWLRSMEVDLRADVDPFAKAVAVLAFEQESPLGGGHDAHEGEAEGEEAGEEASEEAGAHAGWAVAPEEVYIDLVALPGGFSAHVGQMLLPFGVTGRMHPHDWPWPVAPGAYRAVVGEHGVGDVGALVEWKPRLSAVGLTLTGGAVRGAALDAHGPAPAWIGRGELFGAGGAVDGGLGLTSHGSSGGEGDRLDAVDLMLRVRPTAWQSVVLLAEGWRRTEGGEARGPAWAATLQAQPMRACYLGLRLDGVHAAPTEDPDHPEDEAHDQDGLALGYGAFLSYYSSEFLRARLGVEQGPGEDHLLANAQLTFVWGAHPVEPYWVNR